jgi:hypothetical protein
MTAVQVSTRVTGFDLTTASMIMWAFNGHLQHYSSNRTKLIYDRQSVGQSVLVSGAHLGPVTNFFSLIEIFFRHLWVS